MRPGQVAGWLPVVRDVIGLVGLIADRIRARRKRRRAMAASGKR